VIGPLTDPAAHGGAAQDAFHLVIPSLPGYGFSARPGAAGWNPDRIGRAWDELMTRLGYTRYVAQGGDWGAVVTEAMGRQAPAGLRGVHVNLPGAVPPDVEAALAGAGPVPEMSEQERAVFDALGAYRKSGYAGYFVALTARPQAVGYGLTDSPAGLAAFFLWHPGFAQWSFGEDPEDPKTKDEVLDDISLYWLTNTAASSGRLYWENRGAGPTSATAMRTAEISVPVGVTVFPDDVYRAPETWARLRPGRLDAVGEQLVGVAALAEPDLQPPAAELVEHGDLLGQPGRVVQRQHVDQRAQPDPRGAHGRRGQEHVRGRGQAERRAVVLGQVVDVEPVGFGVRDQVEPLAVQLSGLPRAVRVDPVEQAERDVGAAGVLQAHRPIMARGGRGGGNTRPVRSRSLTPNGSGREHHVDVTQASRRLHQRVVHCGHDQNQPSAGRDRPGVPGRVGWATAALATLHCLTGCAIGEVLGMVIGTAAGLASALFWLSLAAALAVAFLVTVPLNRWLISRGRGHAVLHAHHG
jgi:pimeloyl-ACP methyl ester carboxylesterase